MTEPGPYFLTAAAVLDPPQSWWGRLRCLGLGIILTANIIGSGELIATAALGAKAGFVTLWVIIVSWVIKVAPQLESMSGSGSASWRSALSGFMASSRRWCSVRSGGFTMRWETADRILF